MIISVSYYLFRKGNTDGAAGQRIDIAKRVSGHGTADSRADFDFVAVAEAVRKQIEQL